MKRSIQFKEIRRAPESVRELDNRYFAAGYLACAPKTKPTKNSKSETPSNDKKMKNHPEENALKPMEAILRNPFVEGKQSSKSERNKMNPLTDLKRTSILQLLIASVLVVGAALTAVPTFATPPMDSPPIDVFTHAPDVTVHGHFGRMFHLPPFAPPTNAVRDALLELGKADGILDAADDLAAGPVALIVNPNLSLINRNNPTHTAGVTFFGQFLDHDMTFDRVSRLGIPTAPITSPNARTPLFDLDSVYGDGPDGSPQLYDPTDPIKFRVESGGQFEDLPRDPITSQAFLGDPRNDENIMIGGLHAAFLLFHNRAVDLIRSQNPGIPHNDAYSQARRLTLWHYQWMILHEFLPHIVAQPIIDDVLTNGRHFYNPLHNEAFIPVEFQITYRFGHSMVRPSYRANLHGDNGQPFFGMVFDPAGDNSPDPVDLRGFCRAPRRFMGWQTFFDFGGAFSADVRPNKRIDTKISTPLFHLPLGTIVAGTPPTSLMQRNFLRCLTWEIPSGQSIANAISIPPLSSAELAELQPIRASFVTSTPLFYYILKEAELREDGLRLGPLGGRIVAEVFIGLLQLDPDSYSSVQPNWVPTLPTHDGTPESFRMIDFLTFASVDPTSRGQ